MGTSSSSREIIAECPDCGADIPLSGEVRIGREVICPECRAELEIIETDPVELDWAYDDEYDEYDEDEEDEEDDC